MIHFPEVHMRALIHQEHADKLTDIINNTTWATPENAAHPLVRSRLHQGSLNNDRLVHTYGTSENLANFWKECLIKIYGSATNEAPSVKFIIPEGVIEEVGLQAFETIVSSTATKISLQKSNLPTSTERIVSISVPEHNQQHLARFGQAVLLLGKLLQQNPGPALSTPQFLLLPANQHLTFDYDTANDTVFDSCPSRQVCNLSCGEMIRV